MRITFGILAVTVLFAPLASAGGSDPATAEALFRAARADAERADYASACPKFEESNRLDPAVGTELNLADCDERQGKFATAWTLFKRVAQRLPTGDERIALANGRATGLEPKLPHVVLRASVPLPSAAVVLRDGIELGRASFELPLPVDPGDHVVVVKAPGHADYAHAFHVGEGETSEVALQLGPVTSDEVKADPVALPASSVSVDANDHRSRRTVGVALLSVGGVGLAASLLAGAAALAAKGTMSSECNAEKVCSPVGLDAGDRGKAAATISTIAFGLAVASGAAGSYLLLTNKTASPSTFGAAPLPGGAMVAITRVW